MNFTYHCWQVARTAKHLRHASALTTSTEGRDYRKKKEPLVSPLS